MCDGALLDYIILDTEPIAAPVRQNVRPPFTITITISYGEKHGPVKVRRAHLISVLLFVKGKKNTPKQPVVLWVNRRKNPQDVISDPRYEGMSVPHNIATFW